ncbi:hypothetical protein K505DRAFT_324258 [Melanomma pulvis-pyrius CBS 109.77]|uniref:SRR1-like domain-containing protein n=1 Tax=Melanomma pulvis-pyrius CBS 109.77 TaxID=1314802 RepID=A0A6A6XF84_9PLEO|nr:hypothetical protein K505DRAFT_324258 [Melanomma pulvis-pyrius CBS 109.77]
MSEQATPDHLKTKSRRVKRKKVQASDGWTIVTHVDHKGGAAGKGDESALHNSRPTRTVDGLNVTRLMDDFKRFTARWKEMSCAKRLDEMLGKRKWHMNSAACIGIGSFSLDWEHRHRSIWQLVLFLDIVDIVSTNGPALQLYAQEPIFTPLDVAFLSALNISVLASDIEARIANSSFVFAPFVEWDLLLSVFLKDKNPELYIGNDILDDYTPYANTEAKVKVLEECNGLGKRFLQNRRGVRVPEFGEHAHALNGLLVYLKNTQEEEEGRRD